MMQVSMGFASDNINFLNYKDVSILPDNLERFLDGDHVIRSLDDDGVRSYLDFVERNDQWVNLSVNECSCIPNDEEESMMSFVNENSERIIPVRFTAVNSILQRAGLNCPLLQRTESTTGQGALTPEERTSWITKGLSLNKGNTKALIREGKISAMLSAGYGIMPAKKLFEVLMESLKIEHPEAELVGGTVSHEFLLINIDLGYSFGIDSLICELKRSSPSLFCNDISVSAQLQTSDVGLSCAMVHLLLTVDDKTEIRIGESLRLKHFDVNKIDVFKNEVKKIGTIIKEAEDLVEELGNTPIKHVVGCVKRIQYKKSWIPKKILDDSIYDFKIRFPSDGTAMDVYLLINELIEKVKNQTKDLNMYVYLSEECAKIMHLDFSQYDYPEIG